MDLIRGVILLIMASLFIFVFVVLIDEAMMNKTRKDIHRRRQVNRIAEYYRQRAEFKKAWREEYEKIKAIKKSGNNEN